MMVKARKVRINDWQSAYQWWVRSVGATVRKACNLANSLKIILEITASKFQGQHAAQFSFCRYEGLYPPTKTKIHRVLPIEFCKILEQLLSKIILRDCVWKENRVNRETLLVSGFHFFQGSYFILSHETMFFLHKFSHSGEFQFRLCYPFLYT